MLGRGTGILRLILCLAVLAAQASAGQAYVTCVDGTPCRTPAVPETVAASRCCASKTAGDHGAVPEKTCVVNTVPGVDAVKSQAAAPPVLAPAPRYVSVAALIDAHPAAFRAARVDDDLPPATPPPDRSRGPRGPP